VTQFEPAGLAKANLPLLDGGGTMETAMALPRTVQRYRDLLLKAGVVDEMQMKAALGHYAQWGGRLGAILVDLGFAQEDRVMQVLSEAVRMPVAHLGHVAVDPSFATMLTAEECTRDGIFPISLEKRVLHLGMADPSDLGLLDALQAKLNVRVKASLVAESEVLAAIGRLYHGKESSPRPISVPGASASAASVGSTSREQRTESTFELVSRDGPPGPAASPALRRRPTGELPTVLGQAPSANTLLDELLEDPSSPDNPQGALTEEQRRLDAALANQEKSAAILRAVYDLLKEKGVLRPTRT
jgi:hypothetical protein